MAENQNQEILVQKGTDEIAKMQKMSDEQILKTFIVKDAEKGSQQLLLVEDDFEDLYKNNEVIEPLYNPLLWATMMEKNTRLAKLVRTYARNTVGLGWGIFPKKTLTKETTDKEREQIEAEKEILQELFEAPNEDIPFTEVMYQVKVDEESTGNGYLEVSRNMKGDIDGLYHIPSHTMRILKNLRGFVQIRNGVKRYFKKFGEKQEINMNSGKWGKSIPYSDRGNEIIHFKIYTPRDSFYGVPRYVATADAIAGNKMAARRNLAFFKNDATPRLAVTVENGKLDASSINEIRSFVNTEGKGPDNSHRVMILQAQGKNQGGLDQKDVRINITPLTVGVTDDASHINYRNANDEELREAFGIAEVFLGAKGSVNRATAMVSRAITNEQEFIPDAQVKEYKINQTICRAFGVKLVQFEFERPSSMDDLDKANIFARYLQGGGVTPNDIRHELGKEEYKEDWGDKPIQIGLVEYQMGLNAQMGALSQGGTLDQDDEESDQQVDENDKGSQGEADEVSEKSRMIQNSIQKMIDQNLPKMVVNFDDVDKE